ncbi:MAG: hypothetical protein WAL38_04930 [Solirubrobacteraceae bacterium]
MSARPRRRRAKQSVRPEVQWTLDAITGATAFVSNERIDILAANQLGLALYSELYDGPVRPVNTARFAFLDPRDEATFGDWDRVASESVAILRSAAGRDPPNRELSDLVAELATQSRAFRTRWATPNVRFHNAGVKHFCHPVVGDLRLTYNRLDLAADPGLTLFTYTAEPGLALRRNTEAPRQLGSHRRPHRSDARDRPKLRRTAIRSRTARSRAPAPCAATATSGPAFNSGRSVSPYSSPPPNARKASKSLASAFVIWAPSNRAIATATKRIPGRASC